VFWCYGSAHVWVISLQAASNLRFPNMTAIMMENEVGVRYLSVKDFLRTGVPASLVTLVIVVMVGYALMRIVGF
jgi:di/tricarboxylate transporter